MADNKVKFLRGTSNEYDVAEKDSDTIYFTTDDGKLYIGDKEVSGDGSVTIDNTLSDTSENPVQNKVVKQAIDNKADKTTATTDTDGLMSAEDKGKLDNADNTYALKSKYGDSTINIGRKAETTVGNYSTAEGVNTTASGVYSHAEGYYTTASGSANHAEGYYTTASGNNSHAEGWYTTASGNNSHAEGSRTTASDGCAHAEGYKTTASSTYSHAEGSQTIASGDSSHAEGNQTTANSHFSHAEGWDTTTNGGDSCHAEGYQTTASGFASHVEGRSNNKVIDLIPDFSLQTITDEEIINTWNTQQFSLAHGDSSHVEGSNNLALGGASHAEGTYTIAMGKRSHTSGCYTKALHDDEAAYGKYNVSNDNTLFSIGDGTSDDARHNAFEITTTGGKLHDKDIATMNDLPNPNLLTNPNFSINQRGISGAFSDTGKYFVDRWRLVSGTVTVNSDGTLTLDGSICQPLENSVGTNVTASVSAGTAVYDDTAKTFTITGNGDVISWAKLEIGSAATDFSPPDSATELMKCYRFFYRMGRYISNPNYNESACRIYNRRTNSKCVYTGIILPVEMRIAPTVTVSGTPWAFRLLDTNGSNQVVFGANKISVVSQKKSCGFTFTDDYFANEVDGTICLLTQGYIDFDAEIY